MTSEATKFRVATDSTLEKDFDAAIVIPSFDEGYGILDSILNAVNQKPLKGAKPRHCVVVVINNDKTTSLEKKQNNLLTYLVLQALVHKKPMGKRGDKSIAEKVKKIHESKVPIIVVDAFSDEYANVDNNVGLARRMGHDVASSHVRDDGFYVSSDADARLSECAVAATKLFFEYAQKQDPSYAGITYGLYSHPEGTTEQEKKVSRVNDIFWDFRALIGRHSKVEQSMVWFSGGGAAYVKREYHDVGGHPHVAGEEDTKLGIALADGGYKVVNAFRNSFVPKELARHMVASAQARVSERASTGMGRGIAKRDESIKPFKDQEIESFLFTKHTDSFFQRFENVYWGTFLEYLGRHPEIRGDYEDTYLYSERSLADPVVAQFYIECWDRMRERMPTLFQREGIDITKPEYAEEYQKFIDALNGYRPSVPNTTSHHGLYWSAHRLFKIRYPDEPVMSAVSGYVEELENTGIESISEYPEAQTLISSSEYRTPYKFSAFQRQVIKELPDNVRSLIESDPNMLCKFNIMFLSAFTRYSRSIQKVLDVCQIRREVTDIRKNKPDKKAAILVREGQDVPNDLMFARLHVDYLAAVANAVGYIRYAMEHEWDTATLNSVSATSKALQEKATDFADKIVQPLIDKHSRQIKDFFEVVEQQKKK